jgi:hypothetical protein
LLYDNAIDHHNPGTIASTHSSGALTFVFSSDGFHRDHGWDAQIICELLPPCATYPDHIHAENITMSGAKLEWDTNCNPVSWEYELVTQGTAPTGVGIAVADNYQVFSGLNSNTCYDFYIRSICASEIRFGLTLIRFAPKPTIAPATTFTIRAVCWATTTTMHSRPL